MATWPNTIDDDGTGESGLALDDAFFDQIKAYIDGTAAPVAGTFTPRDHYASFTFATASGRYAQLGPIVVVQMHLVFPAISGNPNVAWLEGFVPPGAGAPNGAVLVAHGAPPSLWLLQGTNLYGYNPSTMGNLLLNALSGATLTLSGSWLT